MKEDDKTQFPNVTHYTKVDVQPGGINIQHVEHLHQADILKALGIELEIKKDGKTMEISKTDEKKDAAECSAPNDVEIEDEIPTSVSEVFLQPAVIKKYVSAMIENYYGGKPLSLALIYCVLKDYSLLRCVGDYQNFVKALIDWGMLAPLSDKQLKTLADGVSAYMRDRNDHGKIRPGLSADFRKWEDTEKKQQCEAIATVFGKEDDYYNPAGTIHYKYHR